MEDRQNNLDKLRHSCAHLLAAAVLELYPNTKITIGPPIENGFYYDFEFKNPISDEDLPKIEKKMAEILPNWNGFEKIEKTPEEAKEEFKDNSYKKELIEELEKKGETITFYKSGNFMDLCRGNHVENPQKEIGAFKLLSLAGAYWRGDEKNKMLTRIYGTCFPTQKELDDYLLILEEAKKRDHRKIGKDLGLFVFSDLVGKGLPLLTTKGTTIRREMERFIEDEEIKRGYQHVITPPLAKVDLYRTSGHYPYYKETMYPPMKVDEEELILRPMTCPHHFMLYKSEPRSYKELPLRFAEIAAQFRYEKSGELTGLTRLRMFNLSDAHIFATREQAKQVISEVLDLIEYANKAFGFEKGKDYVYRLSLGDRTSEKKYYKDDKAWDEAENVLREILKERNEPFYEAKKEAAFYGPKIDIQMKNVLGKEETAFTVQYDFVMPKRFELKYINAEGQEEEPIVIHRSSIGALERTMAFLLEKTAGALPVWLSPVQVKIIPISEKNINYAEKINKQLLEAGIRSEIDGNNDTMQAKIRRATLQKVQYLCIIGSKEQEEAEKSGIEYVSVRTREGKDLGKIEFKNFLDRIKEEIGNKQ